MRNPDSYWNSRRRHRCRCWESPLGGSKNESTAEKGRIANAGRNAEGGVVLDCLQPGSVRRRLRSFSGGTTKSLKPRKEAGNRNISDEQDRTDRGMAVETPGGRNLLSTGSCLFSFGFWEKSYDRFSLSPSVTLCVCLCFLCMCIREKEE